MPTMINLGIWKNKNYHFDWEEKVLLEETSSPTNWSYLLLPVTLFIIHKISDGLAEAGLFDNQLVRLGTIPVLGVFSYFLAAWIIRYYHASLKLQTSKLEENQGKKLIRSLKRRRVYFTCILNLFRFLTVAAILLFVIGNETIAVLFLLISFLVIFMFKFDYQLHKWNDMIEIISQEVGK
ncbi:hypothetical protein [Streptococcus sp. 20925_1_77]|uniref:hypothetical protein n=1 Tax=Streptococcus sp. 20925_1_77 TaxID=3003654 RepID=UPI00352E709C